MTRPYALRRLLEHGPLTFREIVEITGWTWRIAWLAVERLLQRDEIAPSTRPGCRRRVYKLAA